MRQAQKRTQHHTRSKTTTRYKSEPSNVSQTTLQSIPSSPRARHSLSRIPSYPSSYSRQIRRHLSHKQSSDATLQVRSLARQLQSIDSPQPLREAWWIISSKSGVKEQYIKQISRGLDVMPATELDIDLTQILTPNQLTQVQQAISERVNDRKPLQYVLGDTEFCKLTLKTEAPILIPRPETEQMMAWLVHHIRAYHDTIQLDSEQIPHHLSDVMKSYQDPIEHFPQFGKYPVHRFNFTWFDSILDDPSNPTPSIQPTQEGTTMSPTTREIQLYDKRTSEMYNMTKFKLYDICSGSGNIGLSIASQFPNSRVTGIDIDPDAITLSRRNATGLNIKNAQFIPCNVFVDSIPQNTSMNQLATGDLKTKIGLLDLPMLSAFADIIVSNPPYVRPELIDSLDLEVKQWENHAALTPDISHANHARIGTPPTISSTQFSHSQELSPWPSREVILGNALQFYERIIHTSPKLLTQIDCYKSPHPVVKYPRLVLEIGDDSQALYVAQMMEYFFEPHLYKDAYDRVRWVVGFEPVQGHH